MDFFSLCNILKDNKGTSKNLTGFLVFLSYSKPASFNCDDGDFIPTNINVNLTSVVIASLSLK